MSIIARLFGKSPFAPLQTHMNKVAVCMEKLTKIIESLSSHSASKVEHLIEDLSQLEHEADLTKNDIRNHLPKSLFMPIDRGHFLEIFWDAKHIIEEIDELLESAFGGIEAEKVKSMVEETAYKEHLVQKKKRALLTTLYSDGDKLSASAFHHWLQLIEDIGALAQISEKLANRIRMVLELK